jgi:hypothetical protein
MSELRASVRSFVELKIPYAAACARGDLGRALLQAGMRDSAFIELRGAEEGLRKLGAVLDARAIAQVTSNTV